MLLLLEIVPLDKQLFMELSPLKREKHKQIEID